MALSDADVQKQINQMMAFIEQEANEKAEEIDAKAEQEFNIEKGKLVQQQRLKIMDFFDKKEKQVELQKKIQSSNMLNQARLKALKVREDHVSSVLDDARKRLSESTRNTSKYQALLQDLVVQALLQLMESSVTLRCREADVALLQNILPDILVKYRDMTGKEITLDIDNENFLQANTCGGVELLVQKGRIKISNTLESRLEMIAQQLVPQIRSALFGRNQNRKFND